jgi:hypothetical protein
MPKHMSKAIFISRVFRCLYIWVGQGFGDFLDLIE